MGGRSPNAADELLYRFEFPERRGGTLKRPGLPAARVPPTRRRSRGPAARSGPPSALCAREEIPHRLAAGEAVASLSGPPSSDPTGVGHHLMYIIYCPGPARSQSSSTASVRAGTSRSSTTATTAQTSVACSSGYRCRRMSCPSSTASWTASATHTPRRPTTRSTTSSCAEYFISPPGVVPPVICARRPRFFVCESIHEVPFPPFCL